MRQKAPETAEEKARVLAEYEAEARRISAYRLANRKWPLPVSGTAEVSVVKRAKP